MYSSYVLAKQAGVNIRFADATKEIPQAEIYLMPSIENNSVMPSKNYKELKKKVADGATLYISNDNGILSDFNGFTGVTINNTKTKIDGGSFGLNNDKINYSRRRNYMITADRAEVLAEDEKGMPIFTKYKYGKGTVYYLNFPLEKNTVDVCGAFDLNQHMVYDEIFKGVKSKYAMTCNNKYIGMTRHIDENSQYAVLINYSSEIQNVNAKIKEDYEYEIIKGDIDKIEPFEMSILKFRNK